MAELMESVALGLFAEVAARLYPEGDEADKETLFALYQECMGAVVKAGKLRRPARESGDSDGYKPRFSRDRDDDSRPARKSSFDDEKPRSKGGVYAMRSDRGDRPARPGRDRDFGGDGDRRPSKKKF